MKFGVALVVLLTAACQSPQRGVDRSVLHVTTTTTMLRDLVAVLGGSRVEVESLVGVGADPHVFQPKPSSARAVAQSDLVVISGLGLEGWIEDLVRNAGGKREIIVASDGVEPIRMDEFKDGVDPHFWFDPSLWAIAATNVASALDRAFVQDTEAQKAIGKNLQAYFKQLEQLKGWTQQQLSSVAADRRVLVTSHDAFNYLGRAFDFEVVGIQGLSTESEASQRDLARVIDQVRKQEIPAVFVESSVNPALIRQVARETGVKVLGPLFSDSLGDLDGKAGTYLGMFSENVRIVTEGLGGTHSDFVPPDATARSP